MHLAANPTGSEKCAANKEHFCFRSTLQLMARPRRFIISPPAWKGFFGQFVSQEGQTHDGTTRAD